MACLNTLKQDIRKLEETFPKTHNRLQLVQATVDELTVRFIGVNNKKYEIHANFTETYPHSPPVWFSEYEDISNVVECLSNTTGSDNFVSIIHYFNLIFFFDFKFSNILIDLFFLFFIK